MQPLRFARGPETSAAPRALDIRDISTSAQRNVVSTWVTSPLTAAAFVPRLYTGALAKGPAIVSELAETIGDTSNALQDSTLTTAEKQEKITDILNKQLDGLLVRGTQVEMELLERVDAVMDTSMIRPEVPQPLEQPPDEPEFADLERLEDEEGIIPAAMPTAQSRSSSALLQLQEAIAGIQAALSAVESNETPSRAAMLKLSTREAWETLRMRVAELESMPVDGVQSALDEATALVKEVEEAFNFS